MLRLLIIKICHLTHPNAVEANATMENVILAISLHGQRQVCKLGNKRLLLTGTEIGFALESDEV